MKPIQVAIRGSDVTQLQAIADQVMAPTKKVPGAIEIESSLGGPRPEVRLDIDIDRRMTWASTHLEFADHNTWNEWRNRYGSARTGGNDRVDHGAAQIDRQDLERVVTIYANVAVGSNVGDITKGIQQGIASVKLPPGDTIGLGGDSEDMEETADYVGESVMLAVILIYLILASQFWSFTQAFSIMFALPLSLVGMKAALITTGDGRARRGGCDAVIGGLLTSTLLTLIEKLGSESNFIIPTHRGINPLRRELD